MNPRLLLLLCVPSLFAAAPPPAKPAPVMPVSKLREAVLAPGQCVLHYRVSTRSDTCQAFVDQGLGLYYSYVWMEAVRSFETALKHDPECAFAHWGLARSLERFNRGATAQYKRAWELRETAGPAEQMLFKASMQLKGLLPGVGDEDKRKQAATATIDELLATYAEDEEGWYFRAQLAGGSGLFGGQASSAPFYKALVRINRLHPGANHELLHFYETFKRPALGWVHAEQYIESSPGIPHAFHMQAHLATRLGRWDRTSDRSSRAIELEREYHRREKVRPGEDHQYAHHLETLLTSLTHDGRFAEGRAIKQECEACNHAAREAFVRLHLAERDYDAAQGVIDQIARGGRGGKGRRGPAGKGDKAAAAYFTALLALKQNEPSKALPHLEVLRQAARDTKADPRPDPLRELRLLEVQGLYLCQTGDGPAGLKLLSKAVSRTKDDYTHHSWGNGATLMEAWGVGALAANDLTAAAEAFQEALAHDKGSVRGALGMRVVCERLGRTEEMARYAKVAQTCWGRADRGHLAAELAALRGEKATRLDATKK